MALKTPEKHSLLVCDGDLVDWVSSRECRWYCVWDVYHNQSSNVLEHHPIWILSWFGLAVNHHFRRSPQHKAWLDSSLQRTWGTHPDTSCLLVSQEYQPAALADRIWSTCTSNVDESLRLQAYHIILSSNIMASSPACSQCYHNVHILNTLCKDLYTWLTR